MLHASLKLVLLASFVMIATTLPAQDKQPRKIAGWGVFVDPKGDCKVGEKNGTVTITVPGGHHNLNPLPQYNVHGPRLLQPVDGDFQVQVHVLQFTKPKPKTAATRDGVSYIASGLLVWQDDKNFLRCMRAANGENGQVFIHIEAFQNGQHVRGRYDRSVRTRIIPDTAIWFRLVRSGDSLSVSRSADGKKWALYSRFILPRLAKTLRVGVGAVNSTRSEFKPQFKDLKVTAGK